MLTEAQHGRWHGAEGSMAMSDGEGGAVLVDGATGVHLRAPGLHGSTHEAPAKPRGDQRGRSSTGGDDARARGGGRLAEAMSNGELGGRSRGDRFIPQAEGTG